LNKRVVQLLRSRSNYACGGSHLARPMHGRNTQLFTAIGAPQSREKEWGHRKKASPADPLRKPQRTIA
jgi:hypothetical protein